MDPVGDSLGSLESLDMIFDVYMAIIADFLLRAIWPPHRLIKDSETPAWLGLRIKIKYV